MYVKDLIKKKRKKRTLSEIQIKEKCLNGRHYIRVDVMKVKKKIKYKLNAIALRFLFTYSNKFYYKRYDCIFSSRRNAFLSFKKIVNILYYTKYV